MFLGNARKFLQVVAAFFRGRAQRDDRERVQAEARNLRTLYAIGQRDAVQSFADLRGGFVQIGTVIEFDGYRSRILHRRRRDVLHAVYVAEHLLQRNGQLVHDGLRSGARIDGRNVQERHVDIRNRFLLHSQPGVSAGSHHDNGQEPDGQLVP